MRAVELKYTDGRGTGIWYCGVCRDVKYGVTSGPGLSRHRYRNGQPCSEYHREQAEHCCTGKMTCMNCTGCGKDLRLCTCERKDKNCCVACGAKLFFGEGQKIRWGMEIREICYECSKHPALAAELVDAP